jgi:hypothetical protein
MVVKLIYHYPKEPIFWFCWNYCMNKETSLQVRLQSTTTQYIFWLVYDTNIKLASLGSAPRGLGSLRFILNIMASVERSYLAPRFYIWRLWFIPQNNPSGGELLELRLLDKKWNRSFFYLPYVYQYLT